MLQWVEPSELSASSAAFPNAKISHARINLAHVPAVNAINITPVFYRTMNQAFTDMLAGQMDIIFDSLAALTP